MYGGLSAQPHEVLLADQEADSAGSCAAIARDGARSPHPSECPGADGLQLLEHDRRAMVDRGDVGPRRWSTRGLAGRADAGSPCPGRWIGGLTGTR